MSFDPRTIAFSAAACAGLLFLLTLLYWRARQTYPGFGWWVASVGGLALAMGLITLRDLDDAPLVDPLVNLISFSSFALMVVGLHGFFESSRRDPWLWSIFAFGFIAVIGTGLGSAPEVRAVIASTVSALLALRGGVVSLSAVPPALRHPARFCAMVLIGFAVWRLMRAGYFASVAPGHDVLEPTLASTLNYTINLLFVPLWCFAFFVLNAARVESELRESHEELRELALSDPLTTVRNRRALFEFGEREVVRAKRYGHALSLLVVDIDRFKSVNDTHGHAAGDSVLLRVSRQIAALIRNTDTLARIGGEEFAVLLPVTGSNEARQTAERLRVAICGSPIELGEAQVTVTVSVGVASLVTGDRDFPALLARADRALYRAKDAGRNAVSFWE